MVTYSLCLTHRNNVETLEASLTSILNQVDSNFEIIVVDSLSSDGSLDILKRLSLEGRIKLIVKKCSRGKGRQIAFENSTGKYVISNLDLDEIYQPRVKQLLEIYHNQCEGSVLLSVYDDTKNHRGFQNVTITPSKFANELGGWHDLQYGEDWEFWARAAKVHAYHWHVFPLIQSFNLHEERLGNLNKFRLRVIRYREAKRCGRPIFRGDEKRTTKQRLFEFFVSFTLPFYQNYRDSFNGTFDCYDETYRIYGPAKSHELGTRSLDRKETTRVE